MGLTKFLVEGLQGIRVGRGGVEVGVCYQHCFFKLQVVNQNLVLKQFSPFNRQEVLQGYLQTCPLTWVTVAEVGYGWTWAPVCLFSGSCWIMVW